MYGFQFSLISSNSWLCYKCFVIDFAGLDFSAYLNYILQFDFVNI